jgi:hypothetical protein
MDSAIPKLSNITSSSTLAALISIPILLTNVFLVAILLLWPTSQTYCCGLDGLDPETRILLVVALAGGIGSTVRLLRVIPQDYRNYFDKHLGLLDDDKVAPGFFQRGILFYLLRPFLGPPVAVMIYFVLRGGFIGGSQSVGAADINPSGICGIAGLAGLFADSAVDKFKQVFDVFLGLPTEVKKPETKKIA